jgi:hypothetical protein
MDVDEPRQYEPILTVDHPVCRPGVVAADKDDPVVGEGDIDISAIGMVSGCLVPGNGPIGVADSSGGQGTVLLVVALPSCANGPFTLMMVRRPRQAMVGSVPIVHRLMLQSAGPCW